MNKKELQKKFPILTILILSIKIIAVIYPLSAVGYLVRYLWFNQDITTEYLLDLLGIIFILGFVILYIGMLLIDQEDFIFESTLMTCFLLIIIALFSHNAPIDEAFLSMFIAIFLTLRLGNYLQE